MKKLLSVLLAMTTIFCLAGCADGKCDDCETNRDVVEYKMSDGDTVIIRRQSTAHNGQIALVLVGKEEATVKKVFFDRDGITLIPTNTEYFPIHYTAMECRNLPVTIAGVVVELRCKFE